MKTNMRSCENCINHKVYPQYKGVSGWFIYCEGVGDGKNIFKQAEWINDVNKANECEWYDEDGWNK
jgi:hypothetical protein